MKVGGAIVAGALVVGSFGLPSTAEPVRLLQTVVVDVASDGSIPSIEVIDLSRGQGSGDVSRHQRGLDPSARAGELPISIRTSYHRAGGVGTDLADVAGSDDPLTVRINVTNQTGRVEPVSVEDRITGRTITEDVMVVTPLTVILSAVLPGELGADIDRQETNGAISRRGDDTLVQWGAVLAPPAVQGTATFTLDLRGGSDFELKDMSLTVEQGVRPDFSVARVVEQVFGGTAQAEDGATIDVARELSSQLNDIEASLSLIQRAMRSDAEQNGRDLVGQLSTATEGLKAQIERLRSTVHATLDSFEGSSNAQLRTAASTLSSKVDAFIRAVGFIPGADGGLTPLSPPRDGQDAVTVVEIIGVVQERLYDDDPSDDAIVDLATELSRIIGSGQSCNPGATGAQPLLAVIDCLRTDLVADLGQRISGAKAGMGVGADPAGTSMAALPVARRSVDAAEARAGAIKAALGDLLPSVDEVVGLLDAAVGDVDAATDDIEQARDQVDLLAAGLVAVGDQVEAIGAAADEAVVELAAARALVDDGDPGADPVSVADALAAAEAARGALVDAVATLAEDLCTQVPAALLDALDDAGVVDGAETAGATAAIESVIAELRARIASVDCQAADPEAEAGVDDLLALVEAIDLDAARAGGAAALGRLLAVEDELSTVTAGVDALLAPGGALAEAEGTVTAVGVHLALAREALRGDDPSTATASSHLTEARHLLDAGLSPTPAVRPGLRQLINTLVGATGTPGDSMTNLMGDLSTADDRLLALDGDLAGELDDLERSLAELVEREAGRLRGSSLAFLAEARQRLRQARSELGTAVGPLREQSQELLGQAGTTRSDLDAIATEVTRTVRDLTGRTDVDLTATSSSLGASSSAVYRNLTGSPTPDLAVSGLAGGGYQGQLRNHLTRIGNEGDNIGTAVSSTSSFEGVRHTRYVARLLRQAQQAAGESRLGAQAPFDGKVEDGSVTGTVYVFRFEEIS